MFDAAESRKEMPERPSGARVPPKVALAASAVTAVILAFLAGRGWPDTIHIVFSVFFALFGAAVTFLILRSGRINHCRLPIFVGSGIVFTIAFSIEHQLTRGSILLSDTMISSGNVPICPITIPFVVPSFVITGKMIFPSTVAALVSILLVWLIPALIFGRGWCGWFCFFGWMDQISASVLKKPLLRLDTVPRWAKLFPYALLLFLILVAVIALFPLYCAALCPLRILYDPPEVVSTAAWGLALVFVIGGFTLLIAGPFLTKKRVHCSCFCPLLPATAIVGVVSPFRVRVDPEKCTKCYRCVTSCEVFAITKESLEKGGTTFECAKCGRCIDECPQGALDYHLYTTSVRVRPWFVALAVSVSVMFLARFAMAVATFLLTGSVPSIGGV